MASFKAVIFEHQKRRDGTYPIKVRLTHKGKSKYVDTGLVAEKEDVTKGMKIKKYFFIEKTEEIIKEYRDICNNNATKLKVMDIEQVFELITKTERSDSFFLDIIEYGRNAAKKEKRVMCSNINAALNNLIRFANKDKININDITGKFIKEWIGWIEGKRVKSLYPACIRKLHNEAKREFNIEDLGIIKIPMSPFSVVKLPKNKKPNDIDIPSGKVRELFYLEDKDAVLNVNNRHNFARDIFMLSFCLWGTNAIDLYECANFKNGRITYNRSKTKDRRDDSALISIKVEPEIMPLIEKYRDKTGKRVFCFYQMYSDNGTFNTAIASGMRQIRKDIDIDYLIFYSARHSFATIARNDVKIDKYTISHMLNHVDDKMKVTDMYIRKDWTIFDDANRKLLDYVFGNGKPI